MKKRHIKRFTIAVNFTIILLLVAFVYFPGVLVDGIGSIFDLQRIGNIPFSGVFTYASYHDCVVEFQMPCTSTPSNACGMTNSGVTLCYGACSVSSPPDSDCCISNYWTPHGTTSYCQYYCPVDGALCLASGNFYGGANYCCVGDTAICNKLNVCSGGTCPGGGNDGEVVHDTYMEGASSCDELLGTESSWSALYCSSDDVYRDRTVTPGICVEFPAECVTGTPFVENDLVENCDACGCSGSPGSCVGGGGTFTDCTANSCGDPQGQWECNSSECTLIDRTGWLDVCTPANLCGDSNSGILNVCNGSGGLDCSVLAPAERTGWNDACTGDANSCGDSNSGNMRVCEAGGSLSCDASDAGERTGWNDACTSAGNACGMTNPGNLRICTGGGGLSCDASIPSDSLCNDPPTATPSAPSQGDYCGVSAPPIILSWAFSDPDGGDSQSSYQVQIDNNSDFSSSEVNTGQVSSSSTSYAPPGLSYNTTYYWRVKVWDTGGPVVSSYTTGTSFTTVIHAYPTPNFTWTPLLPTEGEVVQFTDQTTYDPASTSQTWPWDFADTGTSTLQNPTHVYTSEGPRIVSLQSCDNAGCCTKENTVNVGIPFPEWEEVSPLGLQDLFQILIGFFRNL